MNLKVVFLTVLFLTSLGCDKFLKGKVAEHQAKLKNTEAQTQLIELYAALQLFYVDCAKYPTAAQGLAALMQKPTTCPAWGPAPYLEKLKKDPWGHDFVYKSTDGNAFTLTSLGADGAEGGEGENADIVKQNK